jgi:hypothetical protein
MEQWWISFKGSITTSLKIVLSIVLPLAFVLMDDADETALTVSSIAAMWHPV